MDLSEEQFTCVQELAYVRWNEATGGEDVDQAQTDGFFFEALNELTPLFQEQNRHEHHRHELERGEAPVFPE